MKTVLSIQSHVAYGYVGNRAAVFPLQRLGCDVIAVNTVQFSNHTGYGSWKGDVFTPAHVEQVLEGVGERGALDSCDAVLSGYMGDAAMGTVILSAVARVKTARPDALYCCDPVMGDVGRGFFVRPGIPEFMRDHAVPAADVVTPNQFELEYLTGCPVTSLAEALAATAALRSRGPKLVMVTSLTRAEAPEGRIEMLVDGDEGAFLVGTPRLPLDPPPNGAGDAVAALFLAHYLKTRSAAAALEGAAAAINAVFQETRRAGTRELQLIAAQDLMAAPSVRFPVERVR
ncbi:pyridoxine kinase [Azospirillum fermentarium]|uniref:pyridoxal kinase PdxY n=1 Tax=Azospirillum fermentarium TaxID=1233114 RepID=UPI00222772BA|nr:pyridoxal kinase PdxY [Azospirillum fermentarium]MCW2249441.1 pyridoxine kinase [Azospirillum fermentarium]